MLNTKVPGTRLMSNLTPLTPKQLRDAERDTLYIFSVNPHEQRVPLDKIWVIPACLPGQEVSQPLEVPGVVYTTGTKKVHGIDVEYEWVASDGIDVAKDIVGTSAFRDPSCNLTRWGVFISESKVPTRQQIDNALSQWHDRCDERVRAADSAYQINGGRVDIGNGRTASEIGSDALEAAAILGVDRPWAKKNIKMDTCTECGRAVFPGAARCSNEGCGAILDEAKARIKFPHLFAHEAEKRGPGRPRNDA